MKVSGFTFIRNAVKYDYPVVESIQSMLPICDELIVVAGNSEDNTTKLIENIGSDKIKIIHSTWDDSLRKGGKVLALETNKAFQAISSDSDWAFYLQADEILHEKYYDRVIESMEKNLNLRKVEGLLFDYLHFYGSYDFTGDSRRWYPHEVRIIRNDPEIYSFRDAQGFQKKGRPLFVKHSGASIYHYGWVKSPEKQQAKQQSFHSLWHDDAWIEANILNTDQFDYGNIDALKKFEGTHPQVMKSRIERLNWHFKYDPSQRKIKLKYKILQWIASKTGWDIGRYKNYKLVK